MTDFNINPDLITEDPFLLQNALHHIPQANTVGQVKSWAANGNVARRYRHARDFKGEKPKVKLEVLQLPEGLATSVAAYWRFIKALNQE